MTITANDIIASLWNLACTLPTKTGGRTRSQKSALKQLVTVPGGLVFIVTRSRKDRRTAATGYLADQFGLDSEGSCGA